MPNPYSSLSQKKPSLGVKEKIHEVVGQLDKCCIEEVGGKENKGLVNDERGERDIERVVVHETYSKVSEVQDVATDDEPFLRERMSREGTSERSGEKIKLGVRRKNTEEELEEGI